jgi:hypothetical protein
LMIFAAWLKTPQAALWSRCQRVLLHRSVRNSGSLA